MIDPPCNQRLRLFEEIEVVGNAVRHGEPEEDGRIGMSLEVDELVTRAVVADAGPAFTVRRTAVGRVGG